MAPAAPGGAVAASAWIRDLAALTPADARAVGNKALRQGLLLAAGFPVSPGFCVTQTCAPQLGEIQKLIAFSKVVRILLPRYLM